MELFWGYGWFKGFKVSKSGKFWYSDSMDINELVLFKDDAGTNRVKMIARINENVHLYVMHPVYGENSILSLENNVWSNNVEEDNLKDLNNDVKGIFEDLNTLNNLADGTLDDLNNGIKGTFYDLDTLEDLNKEGPLI